jgi:hypothetical protein
MAITILAHFSTDGLLEKARQAASDFQRTPLLDEVRDSGPLHHVREPLDSALVAPVSAWYWWQRKSSDSSVKSSRTAKLQWLRPFVWFVAVCWICRMRAESATSQTIRSKN